MPRPLSGSRASGEAFGPHVLKQVLLDAALSLGSELVSCAVKEIPGVLPGFPAGV